VKSPSGWWSDDTGAGKGSLQAMWMLVKFDVVRITVVAGNADLICTTYKDNVSKLSTRGLV